MEKTMNIKELRKLVNEVVNQEKQKTKKEAYKVLAERISLLTEKQADPLKKYPKEVQEWIQEIRSAAEAGNVKKIHALLDTEAGKSDSALKFLRSGQFIDGDKGDDAVSITEASAAPKDLSPTQNEIDFTKSVGWPLCKWSTVESSLKDPYIPGDRCSVSGGLVLDGHHRWSGLYAMNPGGSLGVREFNFPAGVDEDGQKLCALQMAVGAQRKAGQELPSATAGVGTNILGASKSDIMSLFETYAFQPSADKNLSGAIMMGDEWMEGVKNGSKGSWDLFGLTQEDIDGALSVEECQGDLHSCPVREKVAQQMADNLADMSPNASAPDRSDMPQLDHDDIGGAAGFEAIQSDLQKGKINISEPWFKNESVDLKRWNKLAGLLKD